MTFDLSLDKHYYVNIRQIKKHLSKMLLREGPSQAAYPLCLYFELGEL